MNGKLLSGLIILGLSVVVLLFQHGSMDVNLIFETFRINKAMTLLTFSTVGIAIGLLLK